ncbi:tail fiber protein [Chitinophaga varians]|uniref:tail fiber protein n=1 Tax=Chitinophaga varians TaxID=2202339 RepID=UPI00165F2089|nr:tail fiber protein [Chitinophaga varians]MBC9913192.1 tail fiber protein [Chitinophaga varians]
MADYQGIINETGQHVTISLPTARQPEYPAFTDIADDDIITGFDTSENKTKKMSAAQLRDKLTGTGTTTPPVLSGADMEITIPSTLVGQKRIDIPALAGLTYYIERIGSGRLWSSWYNVISTGGFELTRGNDVFRQNDKYVAHIYEYEGGNTSIPGGGSSSSFIKGIVPVTGDKILTNSDINKLINFSTGSGKVTVTLDDVAAIEENGVYHFSAMVNNTYKTTIKGTNGQFIYINGSAKLKIFLGPGETCRLYRATDGWYCIDPIDGYLRVGQPIAAYGNFLNSVIANGSLIMRSSEPRLWEAVQEFGLSLVSDATWTSSIDYCGCFSTGDGSTTFRLPDLRGTSIRFLDLGRGLSTAPRPYNNAGGYRRDYTGPHTHPYIDTGGPFMGTDNFVGGGTFNAGQFERESGINRDSGTSTETTIKDVGFYPRIGT